jgi:hypothetical protein
VQSAIFEILSSNAPLELEYYVVLIPGKILQIVQENGAKNVITRSHLHIACKASPVPIKSYMNEKVFQKGQMEKVSNGNVLTQTTGIACTNN